MGNVLSFLREPDEEELAPSRTDLTIRRARLADHDQGCAAEESPSKPDPEVAKGIRQRLVDGIHSFQYYPFVAPHIPCPGVVKDLNYFSISVGTSVVARTNMSGGSKISFCCYEVCVEGTYEEGPLCIDQ